MASQFCRTVCRVLSLHVAKHVRMASNQLVAERIKHVIDIKDSNLFRHFRVEENL